MKDEIADMLERVRLLELAAVELNRMAGEKASPLLRALVDRIKKRIEIANGLEAR